MKTKKILLLALWVLVACVEWSNAAQASADKPNIVFILADDLGYCDVTSFAQRVSGTPIRSMYYETPHLDRLTSEGTAFSAAYVCQLCSPTRASLLTGKNAARLGVTTATPGIGAGGMGEVYLANDSKLDRKVAIKVLPELMTRDKGRELRLSRNRFLELQAVLASMGGQAQQAVHDDVIWFRIKEQ